jgi:hypothetical protein
MDRLLATVALCAGSGAALVQADDVHGQQPFVDDYTETWNTHDAPGLAAHCALIPRSASQERRRGRDR